MQNYVQEDSMLVDKIVYEVKSQGIFDQFRKECIADVDTKPAYQNLRQRVEGSVSGFLSKQKWSPDMNKNHVREMLRKNIYESGFLETGVERIVDQVVNPKINSIFLPKVTDLVYKYFGIQKPGDRRETKPPLQPETLLPTDLEAVSPESEKHSDQGNDDQNLDDSKIDEDESPPFEPLEEQGPYVVPEETSIDSHMSGFSGLVSHDSNSREVSKPVPIETSNQESVTSKQSSDRLSIVMSDDNETKMEVDEHKLEKSKKDDKDKNCDSKGRDEKSHRSRHESRSDRKDKDKKDHKDRRSKDQEKSKERKSSSSRNEKSDKDKNKEKDKSRSHSSSSHKHSSSGHRIHKDSSSSSKDRDKNKSKSSTNGGSNKDKESSKDKRKDDKRSDSKKHYSDSKSSSDKHKKDDRHSKASSRSKDKKSSKNKDKNRDCESETKKRSDRRSTDRDSNDGHSSLKSSSSSFESFSSNVQTSQQEKKESSNTTNSGDSGNSDTVETSLVILDEKMVAEELSICTGAIKLFKPKFASNIHEARRLMKIRKRLAEIENQRNIQIKFPRKEPPAPEKPPESPPLPSVNVSAATWDALEAKLNESIANESYYKGSYYDVPDTPEKKEKPQVTTDRHQNDECHYLEVECCSKTDRYVKFVSDLIGKLERDVVEREEFNRLIVQSRKRKLADVNSDIKNNNKKFNIEVHENFPLPLSPAESDNSVDKKSDISEASDKKNDSDAIDKAKRLIRAPANKKRYSSEDLYKPRLCFSSSRRRLTRNAGID